MDEKICPYCGTPVPIDAIKCFSCKNWIDDNEEYEEVIDTNAPVEFLPTLLFAYFLSAFGIHRFYTGHITTGVIQLLTFGGCGIWGYIDFICICFNYFKDAQKRELRNYDKNIGLVAFIISLIPLVLLCFILFLIFCVALANVPT